MRITNRMNLPDAFVKAVCTERHNRKGTISATTLLKGVKEIVLSDRHWDDMEDDASERVWLILGTAVHSIMERHGEGNFVEKQLEFDIGKMTVTGQVDFFDENKGILVDWKTCTDTKVLMGDFDDWHRQAMIYAWLLTKNGFKVSKAQFIGIIKNHSKRRAMYEEGYPKAPVHVVEFDISEGDIADIERFILEKVEQVHSAQKMEDDDIPSCSPEERWETPTVYAVMKEGNVKSKKNCPTMEEAEDRVKQLGKGHYVQVRKGTSNKCNGYCQCKGFCSFYREMKATS